MRIVLTGASGFLGRRIGQRLLDAGHVLLAVTHNPAAVRQALRPSPGLRVLPWDPDLTERGARLAAVDAVIHTACCYGRNGESAATLLDANVAQPLRLLEEWQPRPGGVFLYANTLLPSEVNPYALSKHAFASWGRHLAATQKNWLFADLRLSQMYGPDDDASKFHAWIIRACLRGEVELRLTAGEQTRDFTHVDDILEAFLAVLAQASGLVGYCALEVGTGVGHTIREFVESVRALTATASRPVYGALPYRAHEPMRLVADPSALAVLGWQARIDFCSGLTDTIAKERLACGCL